LAHDGGNMLGYYGLMHVLIGAFGSGAFVLRLPSALAAAATTGLVGLLGLRLFDRRVAIAAGLLSAVSLSLVYWGQDARGYAPMVALVTASFVAFVALLDERAGWRAWVVYVVLTTAAVYAGLEAALVVPAQLLALLWYRRRAWAVLSAAACAALCCVPLAVLASERGAGQLFWVPNPSLRTANQVLHALTSAGLQPSFYTSTSVALLVLTLVVLAVGAARLAWLVASGRGADASAPALAFSWLLVPAAAALLESTFGQSVFQARYLLVSLPAVALLLAWSVSGSPVPRLPVPEGRPGAPDLPRPEVVSASHLPRLLPFAAVGALLVLRALQLAPAYGVSPENWRDATAYVMASARPGDCIAFYPGDNRQAFQYYLGAHGDGVGARASSLGAPGRPPRPVLPTLPWGRVRPFVEDYASLPAAQVAQLPARCGRVWLVSSHEGRVGGPPVSQGNYRRFAALVAGLRAGYPRSAVASFGYHGAVAVTLFDR
jgi:mannosyltransferase